MTKKLLKLFSVLLLALCLPCAYLFQRLESHQFTQSMAFGQEPLKCQNDACMRARGAKKIGTSKTDFRNPSPLKNIIKAPVFFSPVFASSYFKKDSFLFSSRSLTSFWRQNPGLNLKTILRL